MTRKIPVLSYDKEKVGKWLLQSLLKNKHLVIETKKSEEGLTKKRVKL